MCYLKIITLLAKRIMYIIQKYIVIRGESMSLFHEIAYEHLQRVLPPIFSREEAARLTGGLFTANSLRNLDSKNKGPMLKEKIGKKICYEKDSFLRWLMTYQTKTRNNFQNNKYNFKY
jgi:hypothetical protein